MTKNANDGHGDGDEILDLMRAFDRCKSCIYFKSRRKK